jgi:hypothetical protein
MSFPASPELYDEIISDEDETPLVAAPSRAESRVRESSTDRDGSTSEAFELLDKVDAAHSHLCLYRLIFSV